MESLNELKTLWEYSNDAFLILDKHANILYANPAIETISGLSLNQVVNNNIKELLRKELINDSASLETIKAKRTTSRPIVTSTGNNIISTASPVIDFRGQLKRVICNIRKLDILPKKNEQIFNYAVDVPVVEDLGINSFEAISIDNYDNQLVYKSRMMKQIVELALHLGQVDSTILICGETGVGKDLIARLIHNHSERRMTGNLVKLNCAAIPHNLIESELFGHEAGAYTGALKSGNIGYIELAHEGTLFLDEISELPFEMQSKLLNVLQDREITRVGGRKSKHVDLRIIAATNQDLEKLVGTGKFRKDLYFRLNVIPLNVPPLRKRKMDIPALFAYFYKQMQKRYGILKTIDPEVINQLLYYPWPGNVRELESLVERILITTPGKRITLGHLPYPYSAVCNNVGNSLKDMVEQFEIELISEALEQYKTNLEAAEKLGISLSSLRRKMSKIN